MLYTTGRGAAYFYKSVIALKNKFARKDFAGHFATQAARAFKAAWFCNDGYLHLSSTDFFVVITTYTVRSLQDLENPWAAGVSAASGRKKFAAFWNKNNQFFFEIPCDSQHVKNDSSSQSPHSQRSSLVRATTARAKAIAEQRRLCIFDAARNSSAHDQRKDLAPRSSAGENGCFLPARWTWI